MIRKSMWLAVAIAVASCLSSSALFAQVTLSGETFTLINGLWTDPVGLTYGTYLQGSDGAGFGYDPTTLGAYNGATTGIGNGTARDYYWLQDLGNNVIIDNVLGGNPVNGLWFDLGGQANKVVVFPYIDHGPLPEEALEHTVYLSDDLTNWTRAKLETAYSEGWDPNPNIADGYTGVYSLASGQTFRYCSLVWGGASALQADGDTEIDAVAGLTEQGGAVVPEPTTLSLMGLGLAGLAARLRRRK